MSRKKISRVSSILLIFVMVFSLFAPVSNAVVIGEDDSISVADAIAKDNNGSAAKVKGHIVGYVISQGNVSRTDFKEDHNFAMADDPGETDISKMVFVQVSKNYRDEFGLKTNPNNLDKAVIVTGDLEAYHNHNGLKNPKDMKFITGNEDDDEDLEVITIEEARYQQTGSAKVTGIVTAKLKNTIHIQDETAAIAVRPPSLDVQLGDEITIQGSLLDYRSLLQLDAAVVEENHGLKGVPHPLTLTGSELTMENQSKLATVEQVTIVDVYDGGDWANYTVTDEEGTEFLVRDENNTLSLIVGATYDSVTGIVSHFDGDAQIIPRHVDDIVADATVVQPVYATPDAGIVPSGTEVTLATNTENAKIIYTVDGNDPLTNGIEYMQPIILDKDTTIRAIAKHDELETSVERAFTYTVYDAEDGIQIHHIQGEGHESPMKGSYVNEVEGIVTYKYDIRGSHYFHMQAPEDKYDGNPKTSEAIVVYTGKAADVEIGDFINVTGTVDEYYIDGYDGKEKTDLPITQINARDDRGGKIEVLDEDVALPAPIKITSSDIPSEIIGEEGFDVFEPENYAIDFWESIEAMRVEVAPSKAVAPQEHGDLVVVTEEFKTDTINGGLLLTENGPNAQSIQFKLQPNDKARDFAVKTGDRFTEPITGVVNYGFSNYKVYADLNEVQAVFEEGETEPRPTTIVKDDSKLTIASYNVENFSANTSDRETPEEKARNIARAFVQDMESPDIVGVVEVQDNNGQDQGPDDADASKSYERLIRVIQEAGGPQYDYVNIDPEYNADGGAPNGNIRVGFLYNPERVSLMDGEHGTATDEVAYKDGKLTLNPGRIAPNHEAMKSTRKPLAAQFEFNGESVVVIANHLNSKLGDDAAFGQNQPPVLGSEPQRMELAKLINNFVKEIAKDNPEENVVVLGDMNDFEFSNPLQVLKGNELTNMIDHVPAEKRYSYVYQGNSQVLDHILVSNHLTEVTEVDILHINADFTEMHGRASDHEPVLVQMDLMNRDDDGTPPGDGDGDEDGTPPGDGNGDDDGTSPGDGNGDEDGTPPGDGNGDDDGTSPGDGNGDDDGTSPGDGNGDDDGTSPGDGNEDDDGTSPGDGSILPKTATTMYTMMAIGMLLLVIGGGFLLLRRRHLQE